MQTISIWPNVFSYRLVIAKVSLKMATLFGVIKKKPEGVKIIPLISLRVN